MSSKACRTLVAVAVAAAVTIAAPAAQAKPIDAVQDRPAPSAAPGVQYGDLRRDAQTSSLADTTSSKPAVEPAPASGRFDWPSAAIGAFVATGLALLSWTAVGMRRSIGRRAASA